MPSTFTPTEIPDVQILERRVFEDERGYFAEMSKRSELQAHGIVEPFVQDNVARSIRGVIRGLHWQNPPMAQGKLVTVVRGEIWDVAVDVRRGSPTFGRWVGVTLSEENRRSLWVPPGFAHGYAVLSEESHVVYRVTAEYAPETEAGARWNDPSLGIPWPVDEPIVSERDAALPLLEEADIGFVATPG